MSGIGTLNEKSLHASLKKWCARSGDRLEIGVDGFVVDIVRDDRLIEIQTGNFASIKRKISKLVETHRVRLVYPIAREKWITKLPKEKGGQPTRRRSPKRGKPEHVFHEMVSFPELVGNRNFSLEILMTEEEELRRFVGKGRWRRKGWAVDERRLLNVRERLLYQKPEDWRVFLPSDLRSFTVSDLTATASVPRHLAQKIAYCLRRMSVVELIGKQGRANLYQVVDPQ